MAHDPSTEVSEGTAEYQGKSGAQLDGGYSTEAQAPQDKTNLSQSSRDEEKQPPTQPSIDPSQFPDGGMKAWLCVAGGFCCAFCSFGWANAIGVFQEYYQQKLFPDYSPSTITWIVSLEVFFMIFGAPFTGKLYDHFGPKWLVIAGTFLHVFGLMMASLSTKYYQLILSQGICSPIGASAVFYPSVTAVMSWFQKRRAFALGILVSGSSLAGVIFPIMCQNLLPRVGFAWTVRASAFLILGLLSFASATVRSRVPPAPRPFSVLDFFRPFGEPAFAFMSLGNFFGFLAFFIPFNFVTLSALSLGMSTYLSNYIIALLNVGSVFGRIFPGWAADKTGQYNIQILMSMVTAIVILALWIPSASNAPIIVFAILYGFSSGTFITLIPAISAQITPNMSQIGTRTGTTFACGALGTLIGNPIAGALLTRDNGQFLYVQIFTGVVFVASSVSFAISKSFNKEKMFKKY